MATKRRCRTLVCHEPEGGPLALANHPTDAPSLLRQYFPKGTDLSVHDEVKLQEVADSLNTRPRQTLGWKTPAEAYAETVAMTD